MNDHSDPDISKVESNPKYKASKTKAEKLLRNKPDEVERILSRLEKKLRTVPHVGHKLSHVPVLISLTRSYIRKEYTAIPLSSVVGILAALIYLLAPVDLIPDTIPVIGYVDDATVLHACWSLVETDVEHYQEWRNHRRLSN